jgi:exonuclease 3'-5' domain-containing protein 1
MRAAHRRIQVAAAACMVHIVLVDDWPAARTACDDLRTKSVLGLDIESLPGSRRTSLLQLAASQCNAYIFDVLGLGMQLFDAAHLLPILGDPKIIKLCYDCRGDAEMLFANHGVRVFGLYDLQIVFTSLFQPHEDPYLKGLRVAADNTLPPDAAAAFGDQKQAMKRDFSAAAGEKKDAAMARRPLSAEILRYAAEDATTLLCLYTKWKYFVYASEVLSITETRASRHMLAAKASPRRGMHLIDFPRASRTRRFEMAAAQKKV